MKMKTRKSNRLFVAGSLFLLLLLPIRVNAAENAVTYGASPIGSRVKLEGTSTLHAWTMEGQLLPGKIEFEPGLDLTPSLKPGKINARVQVSIPVSSIHNPDVKKKGMDDVMQQAMKQEQFPNIQFRLTDFVLKEAVGSPELYKFDSKGELTVAGVTNKIEMPITILRVSPTRLKVSGTNDLKMTAYGIAPPTLVGIKTGDEVKVMFDWVVAKRSEPAK
jgi:polyisoprenoid-binding protein YceI